MKNEECRITNKPIDTRRLTDTLHDPSCGGEAIFVGRVRNHHEGMKVTGLTYEAYAPMAERIFDQISREAVDRFGVKEVKIVHRIGDLQVGDAAVWVGALSAHRDEAFAACRYTIDELKKRAPIWKKEHYADLESQWVACREGIAVILAGGKSSRFGSDKLFAELNGKTVIETLIGNLKQCGFQVILSGPKEKFAPFGFPVIEDEKPFEGPLAALSVIWKKTEVDRILLVAGDMPLIPAAVAHLLWRESRGFDITLLEGLNGPSPLPGVYSQKTGQAALDLLSEGRRDLIGLWKRDLKVRVVSQETFRPLDQDEQSLCNINTVDDLEQSRSLKEESRGESIPRPPAE